MKVVGVTSDLAALFYDQHFLVALSTIDKTPEFYSQRDDLLDYWLAWLEDADGQVSGWLVLATAELTTTTLVSLKTINNRKTTVNIERFLLATRIMGRKAYNLLISCPFLTTFRGEASESYINNLLGWAAAAEQNMTQARFNKFLTN